MSAFLRKYNTATHVYLPVIKRAVVDFAVGADWTPATGDVKVSIDGGAAANVATLPVAVAMGNTAYWDFALSGGETTGKKVIVTVADAATKAVEDQSFVIETYGHASAEYQADLSAANLPANVTQLLGTAWLTPGTAGTPDVNVKLINAVATSPVTTIGANVGTTQPVNFTGTAGSALVKSDMVDLAGSATPVTNLNTVFNTDYATVYDTTNKAFLAKLGNFAMGGSSLALTTGAISGTTLTFSGAVAFQSTFAVTTSTSLGALSCTTLTASGAVALQSTLTVTGVLTASAGIVNTYPVGAYYPANVIDSGTAQAVTSTTIRLRAAAAFADSELVGATVVIRSATLGAGQRRVITAYTGSTDTATVDAWTTTPTGTVVYDVFGTAPVNAADIRAAVGLASANLDGQLSTIDGDALSASGSAAAALVAVQALNNITAASVWAVGTRTITGGTITTYTGNTPQTGDNYARLGAPAGASIAADIAAKQATFTTSTGVTFPTNFGSLSIDTNGRAKIQSGVPKNTALSGFGFVMVDSSDHVTGKTGLTVTATRSIDGGAFASCTNSPAEVSAGGYKIDLSAADLNGNTVVLRFTATGADTRFIEVLTTP